jgi:FKBP-type peptidyl-prolyl cis-trans isomerase
MTARLALLLLPLLFALAACDSGGPEVAALGDSVTVAYEGRLEDGSVFDASPRATFTLNDGLIPGFRNAVVGMRAGEEKTFTVPPEEAYGEDGIPGVIPPNATLTFTVELLDIR